MTSRISIAYRFADGNTLQVVAKADSSYPDALDQARAEAVRGFAQAMGVVYADEPEDAATVTDLGDEQ